MTEIRKLNDYKQVIEPIGDQKVPVFFHVSDDLMPDQATIDKLKYIASDERVFHHIAALTDVHSKVGRKNPTGSVVTTKDYIMPQLNDSAPNCGMRMMVLPFSADDLTEKQIDELFQELVKQVPTKTLVGTPLSYRTILEISKNGSRSLLENLGKDTGETENTLMKGNMFGDEKITDKDLFGAIPKMFFRIAQLRLGILGEAGNHFLDLMKVEDILEPEIAEKFNLKKNQYILLMHTGSGMFGQYCSYFYMPKKKEHQSQQFIYNFSRATFLKKNINWHQQLKKSLPLLENREEFFGIKEGSELAKNFLIAHKASANHGFANRALLQINIEKSIEKILKKKVTLPVIYDMSHISIMKENHFDNNIWVHRNGSTRAFGPQRMKGIRLYEETGEPMFAPSSMSTPAYLGVATNENESSFFSAPHGTGKSKEKTSDVPENKEALFNKMKNRGVKLYNAQSKGVVNQDASHYKSIEPGVEGMKANKIMKPVAKMTPKAVLMA